LTLNRESFKGDDINELLARLNEVPGLEFPPDTVTGQANFRLNQLTDPTTLQAFKDVIEWMIKSIEAFADSRTLPQ